MDAALAIEAGQQSFTIATLLNEMEDHEDALEFFVASLGQDGLHEATQRNIVLCEPKLDNRAS